MDMQRYGFVLALIVAFGFARASAAQHADLRAQVQNDNPPSLAAGAPAQFTVVVQNWGPDAATVRVTASLDQAVDAFWTCVGISGASCALDSGAGAIDVQLTMPYGSTVDLPFRARVAPGALGSVTMAAHLEALDVTNLDVEDEDNNPTATVPVYRLGDVRAQLAAQTTATPGQRIQLTITASNLGPSDLPAVSVDDVFPSALQGATWTCQGLGGASCDGSGAGDLHTSAALPAGGAAVYTVQATVAPDFSGAITDAVALAHAAAEESNPSDDSASTTIHVAPPALDCSGAVASAQVLWSPNHSLVPISIAGLPDGASAAVTSIAQDEPVGSGGSGGTAPDAYLLDDGTALVRAERSGQGDGRVYLLSFTAAAAGYAPCAGLVQVCVPHDARSPCSDSGPRYDSLGR
jgi:uncharacterized repeat protein (TIGR01451 family)